MADEVVNFKGEGAVVDAAYPAAGVNEDKVFGVEELGGVFAETEAFIGKIRLAGDGVNGVFIACE